MPWSPLLKSGKPRAPKPLLGLRDPRLGQCSGMTPGISWRGEALVEPKGGRFMGRPPLRMSGWLGDAVAGAGSAVGVAVGAVGAGGVAEERALEVVRARDSRSGQIGPS